MFIFMKPSKSKWYKEEQVAKISNILKNTYKNMELTISLNTLYKKILHIKSNTANTLLK